MRTRIRTLSLGLCALAVVAVVQAKDADTSVQINGPATGPIVQLRGQKVDAAALRAKAKALRDQSAKKHGTKEAQEAELEEADILIKLAYTKDAELSQRRHELVEKLKKDETLPKATRFRLAGASANIEITTNRDLDHDARMAAYAQVGWQLVRDFPDNSEGYASLLRIARDSNEVQAAEIASALLLSNAPDAVKEGALLIHERLKLIGKSLASLIGDDVAQLPAAKPLCLFTWTAKRPAALSVATLLKRDIPANTVLVGICLDADADAARIVASQQNVPAELIYPSGGAEASLCKKLQLSDAAIYLIGADGKITTVSALNKLAGTRQAKTKGGTK